MLTEEQVREALKAVQDPELAISVADLGLVYAVRILEEGKKVEVDLGLTSVYCPMGPQMAEEAKQAILKLEGVQDATVDLVFTPKWDPRTMATEDARIELGME
jgi:metal-sulfur cluster biosynthetic enzyme